MAMGRIGLAIALAVAVGWFALLARGIQTGRLYHYAFAMVIGILGLLTFAFWG